MTSSGENEALRQARCALARSEQRYRGLFEAIGALELVATRLSQGRSGMNA